MNILDVLKDRLSSEFGELIKHIVLFGSRAQKKDTELSDYDILIILKDDYNWKLKSKINSVCYDIAVDHTIFIDPIIISENELNNTLRGKQPIIANTIKNGIYL